MLTIRLIGAAAVVAAVASTFTACSSNDAARTTTAAVVASNGADAGPAMEPATRPLLPPKLTSGLTVPAGETFHLGERPTGAFTVSAYNRGSVAAVLILTRAGERRTVATIAPGETAVGTFKSGDGVLVRNTSAESDAQLKVEVWGASDLAMYYTPNAD